MNAEEIALEVEDIGYRNPRVGIGYGSTDQLIFKPMRVLETGHNVLEIQRTRSIGLQFIRMVYRKITYKKWGEL